MAFTTIQYEARDAIGLLTLNRPATINALNPAMIEELEEAFDLLDQDEGVRVLILTGAGEKSRETGFCVPCGSPGRTPGQCFRVGSKAGGKISIGPEDDQGGHQPESGGCLTGTGPPG